MAIQTKNSTAILPPAPSPFGCGDAMSNARIQREKVLGRLQQGPLSTLQARNEMFIMSIAARIFELKERGENIVTVMIPVNHGSKRRIAQYVLLPGDES